MSYRKRGGILTAIIIVLIIAIIVGMLAIFTSGFKNWNPSTWFGQTEETPDTLTPEIPPVVDENGNAMDSETVYPMPQKMLFNSISTYAGFRTDADGNIIPTDAMINSPNAVTISATIEPANATNQGVNWSLSWAESTGGVPGGHVFMSPNGKTVTIGCVIAFSTQIILTATSAENPEIKATCTIDYVKSLTGFSYGAKNDFVKSVNIADPRGATSVMSVSLNNFFEPVWGEGTIEPDLRLTKLGIDETMSSTTNQFSDITLLNFATGDTVSVSDLDFKTLKNNRTFPCSFNVNFSTNDYAEFYSSFNDYINPYSHEFLRFSITVESDYMTAKSFNYDFCVVSDGFTIASPYIAVSGITIGDGSIVITGTV